MSMRHSRFFGCAALLVALCSGAARVQESGTKKRVAVLNFDNPALAANSPSGLFGADGADVGKGVSILLIEKLVQGGKYTVLDRSALEKLLKQRADPEGERIDAYGRAAQIGRMLGLDAMIIGAVTQYGPNDPRSDAKAAGGQFAGGVRVRKSKAYVGITAQVLDMSTAKVIAGFTATGESLQEGGITVFSGKGKSKDAPEMLGNEFVDRLLPEATRDAVDKLAVKINAFAEQIPRLQVVQSGNFAVATYCSCLPALKKRMIVERLLRLSASGSWEF